ERPEFESLAARLAHRDLVNAAVEDETRKHTTEALGKLLDAAGVPCSPVNTLDKVFASEQVRHRNMVVELDPGSPHAVATVGPSVKYSAFDVMDGWTAPPALGQGGQDMARRWLAGDDGDAGQ